MYCVGIDIISGDGDERMTKTGLPIELTKFLRDTLEVIFELYKRDAPYIFITGKAIVAVPRKIKKEVVEFLSNAEH